MNWTSVATRECILLVMLLLLTAIHSKPVRKENAKEKAKENKSGEEWKKEEDPSYVKYLKQVIEILEKDENFAKKLENVTEEDIRTGKIADQIDFAHHHVRTKLDELKRKEIEYQRQLLRKQQDLKNGIHREYWNPLNDRENPNTFEVEDLKKLLSKHHEEMDEIDKRRKDDFQRHEMQKGRKRKLHEKTLDESKRQEEHEERKRLRLKHIDDAKKVNHPGSKPQLEEVWEEEDGYDRQQFDPKTFFRLHDKNGDGQLDPFELESLFIGEASKIHNRTDPDFDKRALDEEVQRMREHVVRQVDKDKDNFVSYDEFIGATQEKEYEKPDEGWKGIDDEEEYTDDEFAEYEREYGEYEDEELPHSPDQNQEDAGKHLPLAHNKEQEKREHHDNAAPHVPLAHNQEQEKQEHGDGHHQQ